jgi:integrase
MTAHLFRVGAGRTWHYRFQVAGKRVQRSTRETVKSRAGLIAQKAYRDAVVRANGGQPVPTLRELAADWLVIHRPVSSKAHIRSVETFIKLHMYDLGDRPIGAITTTHVELARNKHLETHKPSSANHWLRILKLLAMWAVKRGAIPALPWKVQMLKVQKKPRAILPLLAARAWFAAVDEASKRRPAVGTAVRMMFGLGLRESEAASARWEWIDWQRATYTPGVTKGREAEPVPIPSWLLEHLAPMRADHGLIAPRAHGAQLAAGFARRAMHAANSACSIKGITPHRLRGTFATLLSESGVPIQTIQKVLRHKHPMTTMAYLEKNLDTAALAQNSIGEKMGFVRRESGETTG